MDFSSGLSIGRIRGIDIRIHWSWLVIFGLLTWSLSQGLFGDMFEGWSEQQRWAAAVVTSLLFFLSVLLHELAHAFVAQNAGMAVPSITLFVFGGVSSLAGEMRTPGQEFRVAIAGPATSWVLALVFAAIWLPLRGEGASAIFGYMAWINLSLGVFNLLPGFPLDGGRVLRSIVWARTQSLVRATQIASQVGSWIAWALIAWGVVSLLAFGLAGGIWYILIGLFLRSAAQGSYQSMLTDRALRNVRADSVMRAPPDPVDATTTVQHLVDERVLANAERAFLVRSDGSVVGLLTTSDLARLPREQWRDTAVSHVMVPSAKVVTVSPETPLLDAMRLMQEHDFHQLPVLDRGRLVGLLTRGDVLRQIEVRTQFQDGHR